MPKKWKKWLRIMLSAVFAIYVWCWLLQIEKPAKSESSEQTGMIAIAKK